jgi:hypothetical protein
MHITTSFLSFFHVEEDKNIDKRLAKDGFLEDFMWKYVEDVDDLDETWHYNDWAWEYDQEWEEEEQNYHNSTSRGVVDGAKLFRFGSEQSKGQEIPFHNNTHHVSNDPVLDLAGGPQGRSIDGFSGIPNDGQDKKKTFDVPNGIQKKQLRMPSGDLLPQIDYGGLPTRFQFNFPKIQHRVYSGPVLLKAHSTLDLSELDPEIFAVLQSVLTPYLQTEVGSTLHSYTLEVDYSPGNDQVAQGIVVTNLQVIVTLKVVSDSIESLRTTNHTQALPSWVTTTFPSMKLSSWSKNSSRPSLQVVKSLLESVAVAEETVIVPTPLLPTMVKIRVVLSLGLPLPHLR